VFPPWLATTVHVPAASKVMVDPLVPPAVHTVGVVVVKVTARPEVAVALRVNGDWTNVALAGLAKVIVCAVVPVTLKLWLTAGAGAKVVLPPWLATTVHVPIVSKVMVDPLVPPAVHTVGVVVVKVTARPEEAVALTVSGDWVVERLASVANVIVWALPLTATVWVTGAAGP
jgi:hypothetical protein